MRASKALWLLLCGQALSRIGILAPAFLVLYLQQENLTDDRTTPLVIGLFGAGVVVAGLIGGVVADLIGPRRTIISAQPLAMVTALLLVLARDIHLICLLAFLAGVLSTVDRPAGAGIIARLVPPEQFARAYSLFLVGFNVGMSVGPVLSGFLLALYPPGLFVMWAASSIVYGAMAWALPPDEVRPHRPGEGGAAPRRALQGLIEPFRSPVLLTFLGCTFLLACCYLQVNSALPLNMRAAGLGSAQIGIVLAINAVLSIALLPLVPKLVGGMRDESPLVLASALIAVGFGLNALAYGIPWFIVATVVWTLGEVVWAPMSTTYLARRAPAGRTSVYQGAYFFAWNAAFVVGGPIGITVANAYGYRVLWICVLLLGITVALGFKAMAGFSYRETAIAEPTATP